MIIIGAAEYITIKPDNIRLGNSLSNDMFPDHRFDYMLTNPPFGVEWKKVQKHIGSRTTTQVRSHAQKYFIKSGQDWGSPVQAPAATPTKLQRTPAVGSRAGNTHTRGLERVSE